MSLAGTTAAKMLFYPTLMWNLLLCRIVKGRNWWDEINDCLILGAIPFHGDIKRLNELGVKCIINICAESHGPLSEYKKFGMHYFHLPTVDFTCPSETSIDLGASIIERYFREGKKVYIHCKAGRGRSATIAYCWLVKYRDMDNEEAMNLLISKRPHVNRLIYRRIPVKKYLNQD